MKSPKQWLWLLLSVLCATSMAFYVQRIWGAGQPQNFSDFYAPWWASHELLLHGRDPYSPQVAHEIQNVIYGAESPLSAEDPSGIAGGFAYPPFTALFLSPLVFLPFHSAKLVFLIFSAPGILLMLALWLRMLRVNLSPTQWITAALFVFGSFPVMQELRLENLSVLAAAMTTLAAYSIGSKRLIWAGALIAFTTFKPQLAIGLVLWGILWCVADWRNRQRLIWSFLVTTLMLALVSQWLVPGWAWKFLNVVRAYGHYTYGHSLFDIWFTPSFGPIAALLLILFATLIAGRYRHAPASSAQFAVVLSLLLAANLVVIPTLAPHAQLLLLPGILHLTLREPFSRVPSRFIRMPGIAAMLMLAWPWASCIGLLSTGILFPHRDLQHYWQVPLYTSPILPLAVMLALGAPLIHSDQTRDQPAA